MNNVWKKQHSALARRKMSGKPSNLSFLSRWESESERMGKGRSESTVECWLELERSSSLFFVASLVRVSFICLDHSNGNIRHLTRSHSKRYMSRGAGTRQSRDCWEFIHFFLPPLSLDPSGIIVTAESCCVLRRRIHRHKLCPYFPCRLVGHTKHKEERSVQTRKYPLELYLSSRERTVQSQKYTRNNSA